MTLRRTFVDTAKKVKKDHPVNLPAEVIHSLQDLNSKIAEELGRSLPPPSLVGAPQAGAGAIATGEESL